jgi:cation:H+ antiporter
MHVRTELVRRDVPMMIAATLMLVVLLLDGSLSRWDGGLLVAGALAYTGFAYVNGRRGPSPTAAAGLDEAVPDQLRPLWRDIALLTVGFVALLVGSTLLLRGAIATATALGVSEVVIGLTAIAIGTSLPELATSITATLRDQADVAFGNAIGSNTLNIFGVLGIVALVSPIEAAELRPLDLGVLVGVAVLVLPLMARRSILNRWEAAILLVGYGAYIISLMG